jgi:hypothetical protein
MDGLTLILITSINTNSWTAPRSYSGRSDRDASRRSDCRDWPESKPPFVPLFESPGNEREGSHQGGWRHVCVIRSVFGYKRRRCGPALSPVHVRKISVQKRSKYSFE